MSKHDLQAQFDRLQQKQSKKIAQRKQAVKTSEQKEEMDVSTAFGVADDMDLQVI